MVKKMTIIYLIFVISAILAVGGVFLYSRYFNLPVNQGKSPLVNTTEINVNQPVNNQKPITSKPVVDIIPAVKTDCADGSDTACWSTYNNKEFGFRFKYPREWEVDKYDNYNGETPYVLTFFTHRSKLERFPFITIKSNWSADKEIEEINNSGSVFHKVITESNIIIGLFSAKQIIYSTEIGVDFQKTIINGPEQMLLIFDSYPDDNDFKKIISTLQFIN